MISHDKGYAVFFSDGVCLELQKIDEVAKFSTDFDAARQCKADALSGDAYALNCLITLADDYRARGGAGRNGDPHDMDGFNLWGVI